MLARVGLGLRTALPAALGRAARPVAVGRAVAVPLWRAQPARSFFCTDAAGEGLDAEEIQAKIVEIRRQIEELEEKQAMCKADSLQAVKRHHTDLENEGKYGFSKFAKEMLHIPDNLERAMGCVKPEDLAQNDKLKDLHDGVSRILEAVEKMFQEFGIKENNPLDQPFNPDHHEAMFAMEMPGKVPNTIFHVLEPGYMICDRTLRAAKVGVVRAPP